MAKKRSINLKWPLGGIERRFAIQRQSPFTTISAENVRPDATLEARTRGGSRPGLGKAFAEKLGSGNPVNMLAQVRSVLPAGEAEWRDEFDGVANDPLDSEVWDEPSWAFGIPIYSGTGRAKSGVIPSNFLEFVAVRKVLTGFDTSLIYTITVGVDIPFDERTNKEMLLYMYCAMDTADPDPRQNGIVLELDHRITKSGEDPLEITIDWNIRSYVSGILQTEDNGQAADQLYTSLPLVYALAVNGTTVTLDLGTVQLFSKTVATLTGSRLGFGLTNRLAPSDDIVPPELFYFLVDYFTTSNAEINKNLVVAASNESLYVQSQSSLDTVSTSLTIASDRQIMAQSRAGKLLIADHSDASVTGTDGVISNNNELDAAGVSDWTTVADADDDIVVITDGASGTVNGNYRITTVVADKITLATNATTGTCSYRVERALKTFDPKLEVLTVVVESAGSVPAGNPLIALYQDRLVLAGAAIAPHVWYMSKQGDPTNWNLGGKSVARAVAGTVADAGQHPDPITALAPFHDDYLIFGCPTTLWVLRGNPATIGGFLNNVSRQIGIIDMQAWAYDPHGGLYFMAQPGLYYLARGATGEPRSVSEGKLPADLINIDASANHVMLAYDVNARGVHICITPKLGGVTTQWWVDTETVVVESEDKIRRIHSFWQVSLAADHHAFSLLSYGADSPTDAGVLLGCKDGYVRKFSNLFTSDDGTAISSHVLIGPVALGGNEYNEGKLKELIPTLDDASGDVTYSVLVGDSAEAASKSVAATMGTIKSGANNSIRPQGRGRYFYLKLANGSAMPWAVEGIIAKLAQAGRFRK